MAATSGDTNDRPSISWPMTCGPKINARAPPITEVGRNSDRNRATFERTKAATVNTTASTTSEPPMATIVKVGTSGV